MGLSIDREKVIRHITAEICIAKVCKKDFASVDIDMLSDALTLLKDHESVIEALKSDLDETLTVLSEQPEIVRCRECKHGCRMGSGGVYMCESPEQNEKMCIHVHKPDWFCADGERR